MLTPAPSIAPIFEANEAFKQYTRLTEEGDRLFLRATLFALVCLSSKLLGLEFTEISIPGAKATLANARFVAGTLGWFVLFFALSAFVKYLQGKAYARFCASLIKAIQQPSTEGWANIIVIPYALLVLLLLIITLSAVALCIGDMIFLLKATAGRAFGWEQFVGPWDMCVQPRK